MGGIDILRRDRHALLSLTVEPAGPTAEEIREGLLAEGFQISTWDVAQRPVGERRHYTIHCCPRSRGEVVPGRRTHTPAFVPGWQPSRGWAVRALKATSQ